jgi:hypothetical protein
MLINGSIKLSSMISLTQFQTKIDAKLHLVEFGVITTPKPLKGGNLII